MLSDAPGTPWARGAFVASLVVMASCGDVRAMPIVGTRSALDAGLGPGDAATPSAAGGQLASGDFHACAIFDKKVRCWGANALNELGDGTTIDRTTATIVPDLPEALEIAVGPSLDLDIDATRTRKGHACARFVDATVRCWGPNVNGEVKIGSTESLFPRPTVMQGLEGAAQIAIGVLHTCVLIADGTVRCWGDGSYGELGDGTLDWRATPAPVHGLTGAVEVAVGSEMSCARMGDGTVQCWGGTEAGASGATTPAPVADLTDAVQISGSLYVCALKADGTVACWNGTDSTPVSVSGLSGVVRIVEAWSHWCAVISDGTVQCWGENFSGQLGLGTASGDPMPSPTPVPGMTDVVDITGNYWNTCVLRGDGSVWCWGGNAYGQCGDGTTFQRQSPVRVQLTP